MTSALCWRERSSLRLYCGLPKLSRKPEAGSKTLPKKMKVILRVLASVTTLIVKEKKCTLRRNKMVRRHKSKSMHAMKLDPLRRCSSSMNDDYSFLCVVYQSSVFVTYHLLHITHP